MPENNELSAIVVLPIVSAFLATLCVLLSVWPEPDWSQAAITAFIATALWNTVILDQAKRRARTRMPETASDSHVVGLSAGFLFRFELVFALAYTIITVIWAFVVGLWWIALAILPVLSWYSVYKYWQKNRASVQPDG